MRTHRLTLARTLVADGLLDLRTHPEIVRFSRINGLDPESVGEAIALACEQAEARGANVDPLDVLEELKKFAAVRAGVLGR
jgi:hypothetical protein